MSSAFDTTYWNLTQTLGWIYFRDREFVEQAGKRGAGQGQISLILEAEEFATVLPSLEEATDRLYEALRSEALIAVGIFGGDGVARSVPAAFWVHGKVYDSPEIALSETFAPWSTSWTALKFPRVQILRLWPKIMPPDAASRESTRLSILQLAGRWIAENPTIGIKQDDLAVDIIKLAEAGAFLVASPEGEPHGSDFDLHTSHRITTFDQHGQAAEPWMIQNYATAGKPGSEWSQRLEAARDIEIELAAVAEWVGSKEGRAWREPRGLQTPTFVVFRRESPVVSMISEEGRCTQWLVALMQAGDPDRPKAELKAEAVTLFKISGAGFQRCWAAAVRQSGNPEWSKSGPRRRKNK